MLIPEFSLRYTIAITPIMGECHEMYQIPHRMYSACLHRNQRYRMRHNIEHRKGCGENVFQRARKHRWGRGAIGRRRSQRRCENHKANWTGDNCSVQTPTQHQIYRKTILQVSLIQTNRAAAAFHQSLAPYLRTDKSRRF